MQACRAASSRAKAACAAAAVGKVSTDSASCSLVPRSKTALLRTPPLGRGRPHTPGLAASASTARVLHPAGRSARPSSGTPPERLGEGRSGVLPPAVDEQPASSTAALRKQGAAHGAPACRVGVPVEEVGSVARVSLRETFLGWPVLRQLTGTDPLGRGAAVQSPRTAALIARTTTADSVHDSVCPYCAVGCGQKVFVKDGKVIQIEGDPAAPHSRGRLCPKGSATEQLVNSPSRKDQVLYRAPHATEWQRLGLEEATEMVADRMLAARDSHWQDRDEHGGLLNRTMGFASLGGATLDNEENYLIKKLFTSLGAIQVENQARI